MTGPNKDGVPPSDPTVQWWERPGADAAPHPAQADPTVLRGNLGAPYTAPPSPYQSGANPQPYPAPPVGAQPFAAPQPYPGAPQQFAQATPYPQAPQQWGAPPRPPSSGGGKALWWVLGSILVVGVLFVTGIAVAVNKAGDALGTDSAEWAGDYKFIEGKNACDLVDLTVLNQWASTRETTTHTERAPYSSIGGGTYDCNVKNKASGKDGNAASLSLDVEFKSKYESESTYSRWKSSDTRTTGKGYDNGVVTGLGSEAYYAIEQQTYSYSNNNYSYVVGATDSNISVKVEIDVSTKDAFDRAAMSAAAESQVRKVLAALKK
ncbi:hypothetical protein [Nocardia lasii]|uniref:DUF3558 domain-containing protein n=1 Tax=Nocardia lasii TaxID=1616107 RepID=A0ABW1JTE4_9NOCA